MNDPFEKQRALMQRIKEIAEKLEMQAWSILFIPALTPDGKDFVQCVIMITPDSIKTDDELETERTDDLFAQIMSEEFSGASLTEEEAKRNQRIQQRVEDAAADVRKWLEED